MTTEKMARTINYLPNNKALGPDRILNKALKTYSPLIALWLADIAKTCFAIGHYLRLKKAMTIIVLYKESKVDYLIPRNYHSIILENTFSKTLKKVIADCITDMAEKHTLLP